MKDESINDLEDKMKNGSAGRNYNFFHPVGQFIEHVDSIQFSMDKDGSFHFENIGEVSHAPNGHNSQDESQEVELFRFTHPALDSKQDKQVHDEVRRLVASQGIQEICEYLKNMSNEKKVLLPQNAEKAYAELVRLGMPSGDGFSLKTFMRYYKR